MDTLLIWILVYFVLASQFYILDKEGKFLLRKIYLFFYNLGHRQEITEAEVTRGFVYNQNVGTRLTAAVVFDIVISVLTWNFNSLDNGVNILLFFIGTPIIFLGFWFGGFLLNLISRFFRKTIKTIDDIETGKIDPVQEIQRSIDEVYHSVEDSLADTEADTSPVTEVDEADKGMSDEEKKARQDAEALAALRSFQKGK
ncbi:hypothetical protein [Desulfopila sp. IMCC35008]|uniref:hypothetical protein n=1 Tax=Desulfopila sp. IMCC35008 TaxID=2653858 RepID=UPI0013D5ACB2|nr:hypothetical protein [Desulfopila sp. IMCC35008]